MTAGFNFITGKSPLSLWERARVRAFTIGMRALTRLTPPLSQRERVLNGGAHDR